MLSEGGSDRAARANSARVVVQLTEMVTMERRPFLAMLVGGTAIAPLGAEVRQGAKVARIGRLAASPIGPRPIAKGYVTSVYVEGRNTVGSRIAANFARPGGNVILQLRRAPRGRGALRNLRRPRHQPLAQRLDSLV